MNALIINTVTTVLTSSRVSLPASRQETKFFFQVKVLHF